MRIALAQISPVVGDFDGNVRKITKAYDRAAQDSAARLLLTPELSVSGYPPHDLMDRPEIFSRTDAALESLKTITKGKKLALAVGHVARNPKSKGRRAQNCVSVIQDGQIVFTQAKTLLPTYDVFDEARYFEPAHEIKAWEYEPGRRVAFAICEDLWSGDESLQQLYDVNPVLEIQKLKPDVLVSISASPYEYQKRERREAIHSDIAKKLNVPLLYINQFGATDDILFDGASFVIDSKGVVCERLQFFSEDFTTVDTQSLSQKQLMTPQELDVLIDGLICGIRSYFERTGFRLGILGLSGGIDSAVVAVLAAQALGEKNILGIAMPSQVSSLHSLEDAEELAKNLKIHFLVKPIKFLFSAAQKEMANTGEPLADIALENLQSRIRGNLLMTLSNHYQALVLTTGNKSEMAMGYCTLYGDMCGALAPIGDVYKTRVYEIAGRLNERFGEVIPKRSIDKAPSAELRPNQTDQDSLPAYDVLDGLLFDYLEKSIPVSDLKNKYDSKLGKGHSVEAVLKKFEINEYKRRQAAPTLKVSTKAFGVGRRVPIAKIWDNKTGQPTV